MTFGLLSDTDADVAMLVPVLSDTLTSVCEVAASFSLSVDVVLSVVLELVSDSSEAMVVLDVMISFSSADTVVVDADGTVVVVVAVTAALISGVSTFSACALFAQADSSNAIRHIYTAFLIYSPPFSVTVFQSPFYHIGTELSITFLQNGFLFDLCDKTPHRVLFRNTHIATPRSSSEGRGGASSSVNSAPLSSMLSPLGSAEAGAAVISTSVFCACSSLKL